MALQPDRLAQVVLLVGIVFPLYAQQAIPWSDTLQRELLIPNGIRPHDLDLTIPQKKSNPFRLECIEQVLRNPLALETTTTLLRMPFEGVSAAPLNPLVFLPYWTAEGDSIRTPSKSVTESKALPQELGKQLRRSLQRYRNLYTNSEWDFLRIQGAERFRIRSEDTTLNPIEREWVRKKEDSISGRFEALGKRWDKLLLLQAGEALQGLEVAALDSVRRLGRMQCQKALRKLSKEAGLPFHLGDSHNSHHQVQSGFWVDLGGNDTWEITGKGEPGQFLLILDLQGDDTWILHDSIPNHPGMGGVMALADLDGADHYLAKDFGFAAGLFGISTLYDASGNDRYEGGIGGEGFGFFGLGLLQDMEGDDTYSASLLGQGAASTEGVGILWDRQGNDRYSMDPVYVDDLRYNDHFLSMGQGFATGEMLGLPGGIGILFDEKGHDTYLADIFAQGSAYWHGLGLLWDGEGSDKYVAYQYAQGAGVHEAIGLLYDLQGDDRYDSKGVSQGCGHDRGFGFLYEGSGSDRYTAEDMSQGAGSANGLGVLYDRTGNDAYLTINVHKALGHADQRRDRGSFGFLFDGEGRDIWPAGLVKNPGWNVFGDEGRGHGIGLDREPSKKP